jgi:hypothetical protein
MALLNFENDLGTLSLFSGPGTLALSTDYPRASANSAQLTTSSTNPNVLHVDYAGLGLSPGVHMVTLWMIAVGTNSALAFANLPGLYWGDSFMILPEHGWRAVRIPMWIADPSTYFLDLQVTMSPGAALHIGAILIEPLADYGLDAESGDKDWTYVGVSTDYAHTGTHSYVPNNAFPVPEVEFWSFPGMTTTVGVWAYVPSGGTTEARLVMNPYDWSGASPWVTNTLIDTWEYMELSLGPSHTLVDTGGFLTFGRAGSNTIYFDDVSVSYSGTLSSTYVDQTFEVSPLGANVNDDVVLNSMFYINWYGPRVITEIVDTIVQSGSQSLLVTLPADPTPAGPGYGYSPYLSFYPNGRVIPGQEDITYTATVYVPSGNSPVTFGVYDETDSESWTRISSVTTTAFDTWQDLTITLSAADFGLSNLDGIFMASDTVEGTQFYLDRITAGMKVGDSSGVQIPIEVTGSARLLGPVYSTGSLSVPVELTGSAHLAGINYASGTISMPIDVDTSGGSLVVSGEVNVAMDVRGYARVRVKLPSKPLPAPPEAAGNFPMPQSGGLTIRALAGKTVTMNTPVIVDGKPT